MEISVRALISLKAFGLTELEAVRHYIAMMLADRGVVSAPNMAIGQPFNIGAAVPTTSADPFVKPSPAPRPVVPPLVQQNDQ